METCHCLNRSQVPEYDETHLKPIWKSEHKDKRAHELGLSLLFKLLITACHHSNWETRYLSYIFAMPHIPAILHCALHISYCSINVIWSPLSCDFTADCHNPSQAGKGKHASLKRLYFDYFASYWRQTPCYLWNGINDITWVLVLHFTRDTSVICNCTFLSSFSLSGAVWSDSFKHNCMRK